jgi:hypothetical protein
VQTSFHRCEIERQRCKLTRRLIRDEAWEGGYLPTAFHELNTLWDVEGEPPPPKLQKSAPGEVMTLAKLASADAETSGRLAIYVCIKWNKH